MKDLPASFLSELSKWNDGRSIDVKSWIDCTGNFNLAVGYATIFWPEFVLFEDYVLRDGFKVETVRAFEAQSKGNKQSVEWVLNHVHIRDIQFNDEKVAEDTIVFLGEKLKEIWEVKLEWQFPDKAFVVEFYEPEDKKNLVEYQLSFWQKKHETPK